VNRFSVSSVITEWRIKEKKTQRMREELLRAAFLLTKTYLDL
jgi:hypothetical protein